MHFITPVDKCMAVVVALSWQLGGWNALRPVRVLAGFPRQPELTACTIPSPFCLSQ